MTSATYLYMKYYLIFERKEKECDEEVTTNKSNVMANENVAMDEAYAQSLNNE